VSTPRGQDKERDPDTDRSPYEEFMRGTVEDDEDEEPEEE
jgi:hypothetical protein